MELTIQSVTPFAGEEQRARHLCLRLITDVRRHWRGIRVLHPNQFEVNEAWIAFRLNGAPIETVEDGDFNCIALMDAASCYIFSTELVPVSSEEPTQLQIRRLLSEAQRQKQQLPKALYIPREDTAELLTLEAQRREIDVVRVPEDELLVFIGEAREGYEEWASRDGGDL